MSVFNIIVLLFYGAAVLLSYGNPRAALWLSLGAVAYAGSVLYWNAGLPEPEVVAGLVDFGLALAVFFLADKQWEVPVFVAFQFMLLVNFVHSLGVSDAYAHAVILELANIAVAIFIGSVFAFAGAGYRGLADTPWRSIFGFARPFRSIDKSAG